MEIDTEYRGASQIEMVNVDKIKPYAKNSRTHTQEQIDQVAASIREFGFTNPVLLDRNGEIIAGHCRLEAAKLVGMTMVPVIRLPYLTDDQKRALVIADNQLALDAGWDTQMLSGELQDLDVSGFDINLLGFNAGQLDALLNPAEDDEATGDGDGDAVDEPQKEAVSKPGDIWILGRHRLVVGDSTSPDVYDKLMRDGEKADLIITDPPYNVEYVGKTKDALKIKNDKMKSDNFKQFLMDAFTLMYAATRDGGAIYVFHSESESTNFRAAFSDAGFYLAQCCVWIKQSLVLGRQDYQWQHEPVLYGIKTAAKYATGHEPILYGWKPTAGHGWYGDRKQTTCWFFDRPSRSPDHPTMKPVELVAYPMMNSSRRDEIVLDPFGGSGSTMAACEQYGRKCRTIELDPIYADVIIRRWEKLSHKQAVNEDTGKIFSELAGSAGGEDE